MFTASLLGILPVGQRSDDPRRPLLIAYDRHQPAAGPDVAPVEPGTGRKRVRLDVIGPRDCLDDGIEVIDEFGMVASDLVRPNPGKQYDLVAVWIGDGCSTAGPMSSPIGDGLFRSERYGDAIIAETYPPPAPQTKERP